jgi:dTDP-4-dehydrorhamnose reductase
MKILLLGKNGQVGWELQRSLAPLGQVVALGRGEVDLGRPEHLPDLIRGVAPHVIINAAAHTDVDRAEAEPEAARLVNSLAPGVLARAALEAHAALIHYSTDYVFDGALGRPYTEADRPAPLSVYGESKLEGEQAIQREGGSYLVLRTSWAYSLRRRGFVPRVLEWARTQERLRIVDDQTASPTWCRLVAEATAALVGQSRGDPAAFLLPIAGVYHLACAGTASRLEWAREILRLDPRPAEHRVAADGLERASSADFPTAARRPSFSALDSSLFRRTFNLSLPAWQEGLRLAMESG